MAETPAAGLRWTQSRQMLLSRDHGQFPSRGRQDFQCFGWLDARFQANFDRGHPLDSLQFAYHFGCFSRVGGNQVNPDR